MHQCSIIQSGEAPFLFSHPVYSPYPEKFGSCEESGAKNQEAKQVYFNDKAIWTIKCINAPQLQQFLFFAKFQRGDAVTQGRGGYIHFLIFLCAPASSRLRVDFMFDVNDLNTSYLGDYWELREEDDKIMQGISNYQDWTS